MADDVTLSDGEVPVSIIIPLYNAERFIGGTLTSVLNQTFKDYELLIVDDCSTDRSVEIVKSFVEKFEGRLRLIRTEKNSGHPSLPRNIAIKEARGKYIEFLDNDDFLTPTALQELYPIAEKYNADVLRSDRYYIYRRGVTPDKMPRIRRPYAVNRITPETADISERIRRFMSGKFYGYPPWKLFLRRNFLLENGIDFPVMHMLDDNFFALCCHVRAKNFILVPNLFYIYRFRRDSVSHTNYPLDSDFINYIKDVCAAIPKINRFMNAQAVFIDNPELKIECFNYIFRRRRGYSKIEQLDSIELMRKLDKFSEIFSEELSKTPLSSIADILSYFFCTATYLQRDFDALSAENERLKWQIEINDFKTPEGAVVTFFNTLLTVNAEASSLRHSNDPTRAVKIIISEKKFALCIPSLEKYIADVNAEGAITVQDAEIFLGEVVDNDDKTVSLKMNGEKKFFISPRNDGRCILMNVNKAWEHLRLADH